MPTKGLRARLGLMLGAGVVAAVLLLAQPGAHASAPSAGERAFQKCYACHSLEGPDPDAQGPSLKGIVGRKIASQPGFTYSPALRGYAAKQARWDRKTLDTFIANPQAIVPGNRMGFFGIDNAEERKALIAFLTATGHKD